MSDAVLGVRVEPHHCAAGEVAQGAVLVALVEQAMGRVVLEMPGRKGTIASLTCDFLGTAKLGAWVEARATPTRVAREVMFLRGEASADGELVMTASAVWKLRP